MLECAGSEFVANFFTRGAHHNNVSVFLLTQNLYQRGKYNVMINRNASYVILFKQERDRAQIRTFGAQFMRSDIFVKAYRLATDRPNGYLLVDSTQRMQRAWCLRTNILDARSETVYVVRADLLN